MIFNDVFILNKWVNLVLVYTYMLTYLILHPSRQPFPPPVANNLIFLISLQLPQPHSPRCPIPLPFPQVDIIGYLIPLSRPQVNNLRCLTPLCPTKSNKLCSLIPLDSPHAHMLRFQMLFHTLECHMLHFFSLPFLLQSLLPL